MSVSDLQVEVERILRVADMLCTAHSLLRDQYAFRAKALDILVLAASTWLVSLSFVGADLQEKLTPGSASSAIWIGVMGVTTFFASLVQMQMNWKGRSSNHGKSLDIYSTIKRDAKYLLSLPSISSDALRSLVDMNSIAASSSSKIPERWFLRAKRAHLLKIAISKHLDSHPSASVLLFKMKMWWKDNLSRP